MGSLCNSNPTTTSTYTPNPVAASTYQNIINQAQQVASTPYQAYTGQLTAPINAQQTEGINNINANANYAQPYISQAAGYATAAASPLSSAQIAQYQNPYTQSVVNATQAQFNNTNAQQQQQLTGNAIQNGAFGGDRAKIASGILAGQQDLAQAPVIANLESQGYAQGVQTAEQQQQNQANAAYSLGNLGVAGENAGLSGASAQVGAGTLQQQTQQQADTAGYQQYLQALAFPYQQTQFLAGVSLPAAQGLGGTQTTTGPTPSLFSQLTGAGLAGVGILGGTGAFGQNGYLNFGGSSAASALPELALAKRGGRINATGGHAAGGSTPYAAPFNLANAGGIGWIPSVQIPMGQSPRMSMPSQASNSNSPMTSINGGLQALKTAWPGAFNRQSNSSINGNADALSVPTGVTPTFDPGDIGGTGLPGYGGLYARGGVIDMMHHMRKGLRARRYDDGGTVAPDTPAARISNAFSIVPSSPYVDPAAYNTLQAYGTTQPDAQAGLFAEPMPDVPLPLARPAMADNATPLSNGPLPSEILNGQSAPIADTSPLALSPLAYSGDTNNQGAPVSPLTAGGEEQAPGGNFADRFFTPANSTSLIAAGLGMMAGTSPFGLANIGAGGLKGLEQAQELRKEQLTKDQMAQQAELRGRELAQQLLMHREMTPYQQAELNSRQAQLDEAKRQHDMSLKTPIKYGETQSGVPLMALPRMDDKGNIQYFPIARDGTVSATPLGQQVPPGVSPGSTAAPGPQSALPPSDTRIAALDTGTISDAPPVQVRATMPVASATARDEKFLANIAAQGEDGQRYANLIKSIANYQANPSQLFSLRGNRRERAMEDLYTYDPTYDQRRYAQTNQAIKGWAQSPEGRSTRSLSVAVDHLGIAQDLGLALQNGNVQAINGIKNWAKTQLGYEGPVDFNFAKQIVADEMAKAVIGGTMTEGDRRGLQASLSAASSPDQLTGVIRTAKQMMAGQLNGLRSTYEQATGLHNFDNWLTPRARQEIEAAQAAHAGAPTTAPSATRSPQDAAALDWANAHPNDPRAAKIKQRNGVQ